MRKKVLSLFWLALAGVLFSGYLTYTKLFSGTCALNEGCSYFMGLPTCLFGFLLFSAIFIITIVALFAKTHYRRTIGTISFCGILFSGFFSIYEIFFAPLNMFNGATYTLGLPSCAYGFLMFIIVFFIAMKKVKD
ncbi:MAG: hypothetical protein WCI72_02990 [archaeon]